jgi:aspartate aminotransferase
MTREATRMAGIRRTLIREIFDSAPPGAINLGLGQPDLPTPAVAALAGIGAIVEGRTGYTSTSGDPELRAAVARRYAKLTSGPEGVVITVGSQEALFAASLTLVDAGQEVLYPDPGYPAYAAVARLLGAVPVPYPLRREHGFRLRADDVVERLSPRTAVVILSAPGNPTGACHRAVELARLLGVLAERDVPWISDEVYAGLCYDPDAAAPVDHARSAGLVISSLSKDMSMTGWRVGWVAGPPALIARVVAAHQYLVTCAPSVSQRAALAAFTPAGVAVQRAYLERFAARRTLMGAELARIPRIRFDPPDGAFYYFVDVAAYGDCLELSRRILARRGVITIPGVAFGEGGRGNLRLSFAATEEHIRQGIAAIAAELRGD